MNLTEIRERIVKLGVDAKAILDAAAGEGRALTDTENSNFDKIDADRDALLKTEERVAKQEAIEARMNTGERRSQATQPNHNERAVAIRGGSSVSRRRDSLGALRGWLLMNDKNGPRNEFKEAAQRIGLDLNSKYINIRLAASGLTGLDHETVRAWEEHDAEERALSTLNSGSPVDGYYTIQDEPMRSLEVALLAFGGMRAKSSVIRTGTGAALRIPTTNDSSNKGELLAENTQVNQKDVAFNQLTLDAFKFSSKAVLVSSELLQDSSVDIASMLGRLLGERIGRIINDYYTTGTGSGEPKGLLAATTASGVQFAAQTPTVAEMISIEHSVDPEYRVNAAWMFSDSMLAEIKKITDASTGRPIWMPNVIGGQPDTILGYPFVINQSMAVAAGSGAGKSVAFGDLSKYLIRDVRDLTLKRLDERYAEYDQVGFLAWYRGDGDLLDAGTHPVKHALNKT
jgi:HK97 family phage major capsid protein